MNNFQIMLQALSHISAHVESALDQVSDTSSELFENLSITLDHVNELGRWLTVEYLEALYVSESSERDD